MKNFRKLALLLALVVGASYTVSAQGLNVSTGDTEAGISMDAGEKKSKNKKKSKKKEAKKSSVSKVGKAVGKLKSFNGKASKKAVVYVYLQSASWCPPCNQEMPEVVNLYNEMKKDGRAELILVGHDRTEDGAKAFLKKYKAKFPGVVSSAKGVDALPGFSVANGIPHATMVDGEGNVLASGYPSSVIAQWQQAVQKIESADAAPESADTEE